MFKLLRYNVNIISTYFSLNNNVYILITIIPTGDNCKQFSLTLNLFRKRCDFEIVTLVLLVVSELVVVVIIVTSTGVKLPVFYSLQQVYFILWLIESFWTVKSHSLFNSSKVSINFYYWTQICTKMSIIPIYINL